MTDYGTTPSDFEAGDRVELHPATDLWMRGARFGTVKRRGRKLVYVDLDRATLIALRPQTLRKV